MTAMATPQSLSFKRGEPLFAAGERFTAIYVIQSGLVSVRLEKEGNVELFVAESGQSLCDEALFMAGTCPYGAFALKDTTVVKIPLDLVKRQLNEAPPAVRQALKGYCERIKAELYDLKSLQVTRGNQHCPPNQTAKVFGSIFHVAKELGRDQGDGSISIGWDELRGHAERMYHESAIRIEQGIYLLSRLGYAEIEFGAPYEPRSVVLRNMAQIETFFEFYQNYLYKPGGAAFLKTNEKNTQITKVFLRVAERFPPARDGMVRMPYKETIDEMKAQLGSSFEADQLFRLEQKGLIIKRITSNEGGTLVFLREEFDQMILNWGMLKELEKWNELGVVELSSAQASKIAALPSTAKPAAAAKPRKSRSLAEILAGFLPAVLKKKVPSIRTEAPKATDSVCRVCLTQLQKDAEFCPTCDSPVENAA